MLSLRVATPVDGAMLSEIYAYYVDTSAISYEYVAPDAKEFAERIAHKLEKYPYIVAELDGKPVGYAYASEFRERAAYAWCVELSVYVDRSCRGRGVGSTLYTALLELLRLQGVVTAYSAITPPNDASIALHEKMGFSLVGRFHASGFKLGKWWELVWYEKVLCPLDSAPAPITPFPQLSAETVQLVLQNSQRS